MKIAIIDLGTNSVRLFIYKQNKKGAFIRVLKKKVMVRLGDGLFESGQLSPEAADRTIAAFNEFATYLENEKPDLLRAVATSALRECPNPELITKPVKDNTGIVLDVISGKEEARLIALGVLNTLKIPKSPSVLVDIGGGSTEISLIVNREIQFLESLSLGAGRNQQTFLCSVPPIRGVKNKGMQALRTHVKETLDTAIPKKYREPIETLIGTSGSIRAMARIESKKGSAGSILSPQELSELVDSLKGKNKKEILKTFPKLESRRADLILAASIILDEIVKFFAVNEIKTTSCSLKDGILANLQTRYHI